MFIEEKLTTDIQSNDIYALVRRLKKGRLLADTPYQRGKVWDAKLQALLVRSVYKGIPLPSLYINDRDRWERPYTSERWALIDGKQRLEAMRAWLDGELAVPAEWFTETAHREGEMVTLDDLDPIQRDFFENATVPVAYSFVPSVEAEADLYLLINVNSVGQSDDDLERAYGVATGGN